jgi:TRAP-type C4-dicarboxylate transport system substrate-binding protein
VFASSQLGIWENGFRQITNEVRPINTPADRQEIELRSHPGLGG